MPPLKSFFALFFSAGWILLLQSFNPACLAPVLHSVPEIRLHLKALRCAPCRRRSRAPAHTPWVTTTLLQPLACAHVKLAIKLRSRFLAMDKVAEAAADTALARV